MPDYPDELAWWHDRAKELLGRSGVGMDGFAPLSPVVIESWSGLTGWPVTPLDYDAFIVLDLALRTPGPPEVVTDG